MVRTLKLMADYYGTVLWLTDVDEMGPIEPDAMDTLPIYADLQNALQQWATKYGDTLNHDYPPDSAFASAEDEEAFELEGLRLWQALRSTLGSDWNVAYFSLSEGRLLT